MQPAGTTSSTIAASFGAVTKSMMSPPTSVSVFLRAMEMDDPITLRMSVVSVVIRLRTSPVMIRSK